MVLLEPPEQVYDPGAAAPAVPVDIATMSARTANVAQNRFIANTPFQDS
jgi:hypothetical protein